MPVPPSDSDCLWLAERGASRHPLDRTLLLAAVAEPAVAWADRPLGARDACLMALRCAWFGPSLDAVLACRACGELLSLQFDLSRLAEPATADDDPVNVQGQRFRQPTTRDLAAITGLLDVDDAAEALLCRLALDGVPAGWSNAERAEVGSALDAADPLACLTLDVTCEHCGHGFVAPLDIATTLWEELAAHAARVIDDVHLLASAYGWTEPQVLAMSPARRGLYKQRLLQ